MQNQTALSQLCIRQKCASYSLFFVIVMALSACMNLPFTYEPAQGVESDQRAREILVAGLVADRDPENRFKDPPKLIPQFASASELAAYYFYLRLHDSPFNPDALIQLLGYNLGTGESETLGCFIAVNANELRIPLQRTNPDLLVKQCTDAFDDFKRSDLGWKTLVTVSSICRSSQEVKNEIKSWADAFNTGTIDDSECTYLLSL